MAKAALSFENMNRQEIIYYLLITYHIKRLTLVGQVGGSKKIHFSYKAVQDGLNRLVWGFKEKYYIHWYASLQSNFNKLRRPSSIEKRMN